MAFQLDEALTRKLADLARLELTAEETSAFTSQLAQIVDYVSSLQEVDVSGIAPLSTPIALETPLREDRVEPSPVDAQGRPKVLSSAPEILNDGFKVPPIM